MAKEEIGVITEQGFVAGTFGFDPVKKDDAKKIKEDEKKKTSSEKK